MLSNTEQTKRRDKMALTSVKVPEQMVPLFAKAEEYVKNYFSR